MPSGNPERRAPAPAGLSLPPQGADAREVFFVLPGLNLHPHRLDACAASLVQAGAATLAPRLQGFATPGDPALGRVRPEDWLADLDQAWRQAQAHLPRAEPSLLGFSLGALLGLVWALERGIALRRAVLLSPALRLKRRHRALIGGLGLLLPRRLRIPSRSPAGYRFHPATSVAAYRALAGLERRFAPHLAGWLAGNAERLPPLLVAFAPRDELVDVRPLAALARTAPAQVTLLPLAHRPRAGFPRHLGLDAHTLGEAEWRRLSATLGDWLRHTAPDTGPPGSATGDVP